MIVLDPSVALAALTGHTRARHAIVDRRLLAPAHIDVELTHALRGLTLGGHIGPTDAHRILDIWRSLAIDRLPLQPLLPRIWELRDNLTGYDAAFVAAAEAHGVPLVTADKKLAAATGPRCAIHLIPS
ncbi:MAG TPA: type II toxin-antitoxin system VapC family toxin [Tessaracoccus flavescens]|uniref:Ribonuclease VapC n=1 Tax=Tessaracoccus flavescens TaxID=399497 RepID=A0A921JR85_9ACTN|nr:type II toxin-antitoxin system VapC family toxin [Tessaracoccus flavescens]